MCCHTAVVVRGERAEEWEATRCKPWKGRVTYHAGPALHAISLSDFYPCCHGLGDLFDKHLHVLLVDAVNVDRSPVLCNNI